MDGGDRSVTEDEDDGSKQESNKPRRKQVRYDDLEEDGHDSQHWGMEEPEDSSDHDDDGDTSMGHFEEPAPNQEAQCIIDQGMQKKKRPGQPGILKRVPSANADDYSDLNVSIPQLQPSTPRLPLGPSTQVNILNSSQHTPSSHTPHKSLSSTRVATPHTNSINPVNSGSTFTGRSSSHHTTSTKASSVVSTPSNVSWQHPLTQVPREDSVPAQTEQQRKRRREVTNNGDSDDPEAPHRLSAPRQRQRRRRNRSPSPDPCEDSDQVLDEEEEGQSSLEEEREEDGDEYMKRLPEPEGKGKPKIGSFPDDLHPLFYAACEDYKATLFAFSPYPEATADKHKMIRTSWSRANERVMDDDVEYKLSTAARRVVSSS
jgi:hypothetical protein